MLLNKLLFKNKSSNTPPMDSDYPKGLVAGINTKTDTSVLLEYEHLVQHVSICGMTGSGISILHESLILQQMGEGGGLLYIDGGRTDKGLETFKENVCALGRESDFMLIDLADPENPNSYNLEESILNNKIIYVRLPMPNANLDADALVKVVIAECRSAILRLQQLSVEELPSPPFLFIPNNCSSYIDESWSRMFEQGRSARFSMIPTFQTFKSLERDGDDLLSDIVSGNTYYKFYFKQQTMDAAMQVAEQIGMKRSSDGVDSYIVEPEQIMSLPVGECFLSVCNNQIYRLSLPFPDEVRIHYEC